MTNLYKRSGKWLVLAMLATNLCACKKLLDVDPPKSRVATEDVFKDDATAISAVMGLYASLVDGDTYAAGTASVTMLSGLSADELVDFSRQNVTTTIEFESNNIRPANARLSSLWKSMYKIIYQTNAILEGMDKGTALTASTKKQLRGESLLVRAFSYYYLVNLFGKVPLVLTTNYEVNALATRTATEEVYSQITKDLIESIDLLGEEYITTDDDFVTKSRARPNKFAAIAVLARAYLYQQQWVKAEELASKIIANTNLYELPADLNAVFLMNSREAIWQLRFPGNVTAEAIMFITGYESGNVLAKKLVLAFEPGDNRKRDWVRETSPGDSVFYPFKYKHTLSEEPVTEYSMVIRLAEIYLLRAEARAQQNKLAGAITDVDAIRQRAGLSLIKDTRPNIGQNDLLLSIEQERRFELFTEWGHRWLDLKRTNRATAVLGPLKPGWKATDTLYPVPALEFTTNPRLGLQNDGY